MRVHPRSQTDNRVSGRILSPTNDKARFALASPSKEDPGDMATTSKPLGLWRRPTIPGGTPLYTLFPLS